MPPEDEQLVAVTVLVDPLLARVIDFAGPGAVITAAEVRAAGGRVIRLGPNS